MQIAVGIPVYNDTIFIEKSVKNCLDMEYDHVVYLDDGSTDNSYEHLMDLTDSYDHIKVLRNKENSVLAASGNRWETVAEECRKFDPDWIMVRATDELLSYNTVSTLKDKISLLDSNGVNMVVFNYIHLWRSEWWHRVDDFWGGHHSISLWKNATGWKFNYGSGIHLGGHRPNHMDVKDVVHNINDVDPRDIVVLHYGMSSHDLLSMKFDYQIKTSLDIGSRAAGMPSYVPSPITWKYINGYKIAHEKGIQLKKVDTKWFNCPIPDEPKPEIQSLYDIINKYSKQVAEEYAKIYGR